MILVVGDTTDARELAIRAPVDAMRVDSVEATSLVEHHVAAVVDATDPYDDTMSASAAICATAGVPLLRLEPSGWSELPRAARWHWVDTLEDAALLAAELGETTFLATGRSTLDAFTDHLTTVVARVEEPAAEDAILPEGWLIVLDRGPYTVEEERSLFTEHGVDVLVTKDDGGDAAQVEATDELGIEVIVVRRPAPPEGVETVGSVDAAIEWIARH